MNMYLCLCARSSRAMTIKNINRENTHNPALDGPRISSSGIFQLVTRLLDMARPGAAYMYNFCDKLPLSRVQLITTYI